MALMSAVAGIPRRWSSGHAVIVRQFNELENCWSPRRECRAGSRLRRYASARRDIDLTAHAPGA